MNPSRRIHFHVVTLAAAWLWVVLCFPCAALAACSRIELAAAGPYPVGTRTVTVTRPNASTFSARLYYPATVAGASTPINPVGRPYPAITFGHGFVQSVGTYTSTLQHLASRGYIVIASESEGGLFPSHSNFALDLRHCLTWLEQQHASGASFLFDSVNTQAFGASGHSMGGGASILAAAGDPRIIALAPLAPANTNPSAITASAAVDQPICLITGDDDTIVPTASHGLPMYNALPGPRQLVTLAGGFHCGFQDSSGFGCDSGSMSRVTQLQLTRGLLTAFFDVHLRNDASRWSCVWGPDGLTDPSAIVQADPRANILASPTSVASNPDTQVSVALTITNTASVARSFNLQVENSSWPASSGAIDPPATGAIAPNSSATATLTITVPSSGPATTNLIVSAEAADHSRAYVIVPATRVCLSDVTGDGVVGVADLLAVITAWGACPPAPATCPADISTDGVVGVADLLAVIEAWGACR